MSCFSCIVISSVLGWAQPRQHPLVLDAEDLDARFADVVKLFPGRHHLLFAQEISEHVHAMLRHHQGAIVRQPLVHRSISSRLSLTGALQAASARISLYSCSLESLSRSSHCSFSCSSSVRLRPDTALR